MFKKRNKVTPAPVPVKAKELRRVHKSDDLQRTYELAQELAAQQETPTVEINCCKIC